MSETKQKPSSLDINFPGDFFAQKLRIAMDQIQSYVVETESLTRLVHEMRIETEKYHQIAADFQNETDQCHIDLQECSSIQHDLLKSTGHIGISVIRHVEGARETDSCVGTTTSSGYVTSSSCCQADQMFLFEFENSTEITIEENSVWIEEHICFINTTETFKFHFPTLDSAETQLCTFFAYDESQGKFNEHQLQIETKNCVDSTCSWKIESLESAKILDGTSIICEGSPHFGIVTKSKL